MINTLLAQKLHQVAIICAAACFGLAAPAQADVTHNQWVHDIQHQATVGSVTPVFGNGR